MPFERFNGSDVSKTRFTTLEVSRRIRSAERGDGA